MILAIVLVAGAIVIAAVVLVVLLLILAYRRRKRRVASLAAYAAGRGWTYTEAEPALVALSARAPFGVGHSRAAIDVLRGVLQGTPFVSFTYTYAVTQSTGESSSTITYVYMVTSIRTPASNRLLQIAPEGPLAGLLGAVGIRDLQLESEDFNRRFHINTDSDRFAYDVLSPTTMQRMLADPRYAQPLRFENSNLFTWVPGELKAARVDAQVQYLVDTLRAVPDYAWAAH